MELAQLIEGLSRPEAFPVRPLEVSVRHTHISAVFLAGDLVYKIKKPVDFGFLNFLTLEDRKKYCEAEVSLNRRLAPDVYLGVVPVVMGEGGPVFEGEGEALEWAVKMRRLPDGATLAALLTAGKVGEEDFRKLGKRIARFHLETGGGPEVAVHGSFAVVEKNSSENFTQSLPQAGVTIDGKVLDRLAGLNEKALAKLRPLIEARAAKGMTRDVHGDLHLDHVYLLPGRTPPDDMAVLDCVEFSDAYRCSDIVADAAFMCMDLLFRGRRDLKEVFADSYFEGTGDGEGRDLLDFYIAYRAAVRGKVEGMTALAKEVPENIRASMTMSSTAHWLVALGNLAPPGERPALILTSGLPGSGKSRLAIDIAEKAGFERIVSDVVRKELAGLEPTNSARAGFGEGIYTPEWNTRTYAECLKRAREALFAGGRVIVDASFREEEKRAMFRELALSHGVPFAIMHRTAPEGVLKERLSRRGARSVSDADWEISREAARVWEPSGRAGDVFEIPHMEDKTGPIRTALAMLSQIGLYQF